MNTLKQRYLTHNVLGTGDWNHSVGKLLAIVRSGEIEALRRGERALEGGVDTDVTVFVIHPLKLGRAFRCEQNLVEGQPRMPPLWQRSDMKALLPPTRGYFAIGVEGISKAIDVLYF